MTTTSAILNLEPPKTEKGVTSQHLWVAGFEGRRVPALVLTPENADEPRPVILLGHGAGGSKDELQMLQIARWLVRREAFAVAIIDGPVHGERRATADGNVGLEARQALVSPDTYEGMAADWRCTLDACAALPNVGSERAAYLGFSMGTVLGVPTVASEPRLRCVVFAIGGVIGERPDFLTGAASQIELPVLMINQSEDEIFSREAVFRLYDALRGPKRVFFYPGGHTGVPREAMERVREFLHAHLAADGAESDNAPRGAW
jgi:dienelactone hydrolase